MAFRKKFLVSDQTINTYGFAVRTAGIRLDNAKKNCPAFYEHDSDDIPLGHWEEFEIDGVKLFATLVIEGANEIEKTYIRKIQNGDIKGASIGVDPITWNNDPEKLQQGQTMPWLEECDLFEMSITALPGNKNALALKKDGCIIRLNSSNKKIFIPEIKNEPDMKQIALKLGLHENATENEIVAAIAAVQLKSTHVDAMLKVIEDKVALGLSEEQKKFFVTLTKSDMASAMSFLELHKATEETTVTTTATTQAATLKVIKDVPVSTLLKKGLQNQDPASDPDEKKTFDYLQRHDSVELSRISKEDPEQYAKLVSDYRKGTRYKGK